MTACQGLHESNSVNITNWARFFDINARQFAFHCLAFPVVLRRKGIAEVNLLPKRGSWVFRLGGNGELFIDSWARKQMCLDLPYFTDTEI